MIKLEINVQPKSSKYQEFTQSLQFIKNDLQKLCSFLQIDENEKSFSIVAEVNTLKELTKILYSTELKIISGAIRMLGEKSEVIIHGLGDKKKGTDLREIKLNYLRIKKEKINS